MLLAQDHSLAHDKEEASPFREVPERWSLVLAEEQPFTAAYGAKGYRLSRASTWVNRLGFSLRITSCRSWLITTPAFNAAAVMHRSLP
jgi:hypothetical protein